MTTLRGVTSLLLLLAFLEPLASGCGDAAKPATQQPPCPPGAGAPITERMLRDSLAEEGVRMFRDNDCSSEFVLLSNLTSAMPSEREDEIIASEGHILCEVYDQGAATRIERFVWRNDPEPTYVRVLNVSCAIYPKTKRQTNQLERALRGLPGVSALPSTLPSEDAKHD